MNATSTENAVDFVVSRTFNAPCDVVWQAWTERDELMRWFGPKGFTMTTAKLDFRPGGTFLYALKGRLETQNLKVLFRDSEGLSELEQQEIVRTSRINLSTFAACDAGAEPSWGLPERCYGVPASGGFLLADRRRHAPEDFADGERAEYEGLEDCVAKVRHYLANFGEARAIAERAQARAAREHGYRNRAARLLDCARHAG